MNYQNIDNGAVISEECYNKLPDYKKRNYRATYDSVSHQINEDDGGDFLLSALVAYSTDSTMLGAIVGGDLMGAIVGDLLNNDDSSSSISSDSSSCDFGGGDFGGGGAGSEW